LKHLQKGFVELMMGVFGRYLDQGWCNSHLFSGVGCWEWSTVRRGFSYNFSFWNKFIIVLLCGL